MAGETVEKGHLFRGPMSWSGIVAQDERVPDLLWPQMLDVYDQMATDSQLVGLMRGVTSPLRGMRWYIDPAGASDEVARHVSRNMQLPLLDEPPEPWPRSTGRFSWARHLRAALLALRYGHMLFYQVYRVDGELFSIDKWAERHPKSITEWLINDRGEVTGYKQGAVKAAQTEILLEGKWMLRYSIREEAAGPLGESLFRGVYRPWLLKDRMLRVDAISKERNGMGVPMIEAPPGATPLVIADLERMASRFRAGESSGMALPAGARLRLVGVEGSVPSALESMTFYNAEMSKAFLEMFIELGQTETGSRALGASFIDFFVQSLGEVAADIALTAQNGIEDLVTLNWGDAEPAPQLRYAEQDPELAIDELATAIANGLITVDDEVRSWFANRFRLPKPKPVAPAPAPVADPATGVIGRPGMPVAASNRHRHVRAAGGRHRTPNAVEMAAGTDFDVMEQAVDSMTEALVKIWNEYKPQVIEAAAAAVAEVLSQSDYSQLPSVIGSLAFPVPPEALETVRGTTAAAAAEATTEAKKQGHDIELDMEPLMVEMDQRTTMAWNMQVTSVAMSAVSAATISAGLGVSIDDVVTQVTEHLEELTDAQPVERFGQLAMAATNQGRMEVMEQVPGKVYASELLDSNTCANCAEIDGKEYTSVSEARLDYPSGGHSRCLGGPRCRGTVVKVYEEE